MKVYIVIAEDQFGNSHIINVYDSEYNAKAFCKKEYGIRIEDWTKYVCADDFFYDDDEDDFYVMSDNLMLSNFEIIIKEVKC